MQTSIKLAIRFRKSHPHRDRVKAIMSDKNRKNSMFSNQDTLVRRAWIESALNSVKSHLDPNLAEYGLVPEVAGLTDPAAASQQNATSSPAAGDRSRPNLYVAWSAPERRSGT
jgi:hypothetical protein